MEIRQKGHIIEKVILCEKALPEIYRHLKRVPKRDIESKAAKVLRELSESGLEAAASSFCEEMESRIQQGKSVKEYFDISNREAIKDLVRAVDLVERNQEECFIREFSIMHFNDSKKFEKMIAKVCRIIKEYIPEYADQDNYEVLSEYQIYRTPAYVYIKGDIRFETKEGRVIDAAAFPNGLGFSLTGEMIKSLDMIVDDSIRNIFTIENLTTFFRFKRENSLIVYLGGYHDRMRRSLLQKIYKLLPCAEYYHFGDIDAGGFQIYHHLTEKTGIPFKMFDMDIKMLKQYGNHGRPLTENDKRRLKKLLDRTDDPEEKDTIRYMLENDLKLEQECMTMHT